MYTGLRHSAPPFYVFEREIIDRRMILAIVYLSGPSVRDKWLAARPDLIDSDELLLDAEYGVLASHAANVPGWREVHQVATDHPEMVIASRAAGRSIEEFSRELVAHAASIQA